MAERRDRLVLDGATFRWDDVPARRWRPDRLQELASVSVTASS
jgi:hypothetical protein